MAQTEGAMKTASPKGRRSKALSKEERGGAAGQSSPRPRLQGPLPTRVGPAGHRAGSEESALGGWELEGAGGRTQHLLLA